MIDHAHSVPKARSLAKTPACLLDMLCHRCQPIPSTRRSDHIISYPFFLLGLQPGFTKWFLNDGNQIALPPLDPSTHPAVQTRPWNSKAAVTVHGKLYSWGASACGAVPRSVREVGLMWTGRCWKRSTGSTISLVRYSHVMLEDD